MKTTHRNIFAGLLVAALAVIAQSTSAQVYWQLLSGTTNNVLGSQTGTYTTLIVNSRNARAMAVQESFKLDTSGSSAVVTHIDGSLDGANWVTDAFGPLSITGNGTSAVVGVTNFDASGYLAVRVHTVVNGNIANLTNLVIAASTKVGVDAYSGLSASLPVWTDANKLISTPTVAAALAALGLVPSTNGTMWGMTLLGTVTPWAYVATNLTMLGTESPAIGLVGAHTASLPGASTNYGHTWTITAVGTGTNGIYLTDGTTPLWTNATGRSSRFYCDGTNWWAFGGN